MSTCLISAYLSQSDEELEQIRQDYKSGKLLTSEIKKRYILSRLLPAMFHSNCDIGALKN